MVSTSDFRPGLTKILWNGEPWLVISFVHVKPGKGGAFLKTKIKNLITGRVQEATFRSGERFEQPDLENKQVQFLYQEDGSYHFMDLEDFEELVFGEDVVEGVKKYLKEQEEYTLVLFDGKPIAIEPPMFMELKVVSTPPGVKGNTAQGGSKPATLETGLTLQVPLFVNEGDVIKIDTREDKYLERVSEAEES